jgi:hypothetical protein
MEHMPRRRRRSGARPGDSASPVQKAILSVGFVAAVASGIIAYQLGGPYGERFQRDPRIQRTYNLDTGRLELMAWDRSGNLQFDTWSYMDGERLVRREVDENEDGRIDRWDYFDANGVLERVGFSTADTGEVDAYRYLDEQDAVARIEYAAVPAGLIRRTEYYDLGALMRFEEDTGRRYAADDDLGGPRESRRTWRCPG